MQSDVIRFVCVRARESGPIKLKSMKPVRVKPACMARIRERDESIMSGRDRGRNTQNMNRESGKEPIRLNKYLASCGVCSRRDADALIAAGGVTINGMRADVGTRVLAGDVVEVNGKRLRGEEEKAVLAFHKPVGITCSERDRHAEKVIMDLIDYPVRVTYAGRLDKDSEGLMILTNDGALIDAMMRGGNAHEKEYLVRVDREVTQEFLRKLSEGVYLEDLDLTTRRCETEAIGKYSFRMVLTQGVNRQIKRMCRALGYRVRSIKRVRIMNIRLGRLEPGKYREIKGGELAALYKECGLAGNKAAR